MSTTTESGQRCIGDWMIDSNPIGQGSFAVVWKAKHSTTHKIAAIKEINLTKLNSRLKQSLESEISVLTRISHRNVVQLYDVLETNNKMFLIMEYCSGGDLSQYFKAKKTITEKDARYLMQDLAAGLKEMWTHSILHRDLKPQNLLLSTPATETTSETTSNDPYIPPPTLKIADFGFARALGPHLMAETLCGSPLYMAPEILLSQKYDAKADLWSVGCILYEALSGRPPYTGGNHVALLRNIQKRGASLPLEIASGLSPECRELVSLLLKRNVAERVTFEEFFACPFLCVGSDTQHKSKISVQQQQHQQIIVGFQGGGGIAENENAAAAGAAPPQRIVASPTDSIPVSKLTEQFKPRLVSIRSPIQPPSPPVTVGGGGGHATTKEEDEDDDYVLVSATNSFTNKLNISPAATPPVQKSARVLPHSVDTTTRKTTATGIVVVPQEAFLLHRQSKPTTASADTMQINVQSSSNSHRKNHRTTELHAVVVVDAVPWQAASRRQFLKTMAEILYSLGKDLEDRKQTFISLHSNINEINVLSQQLALYNASLQLYSLVLLGEGGGDGGNNSDSGSISDDSEAVYDHSQVETVLQKADETAVALKQEISASSHDAFLQNPWQICHAAALRWAEEAASEELLGNYSRSEKLYCRSGTVFHFLSAEASAISSIVELAAEDEGALRRCASAAAVRWAVCSSLAEREEQGEE